MRAAFLIASLLAAASPEPGPRQAWARVVSPSGQPQRGVIVFAADAATDAIVGVASSDDEGKVTLALPRRRHNFGVLSATLGVTRLISRGPSRFDLVVTPLPADRVQATGDGAAIRIATPRAFVVHGRVIDETGVALAEIRVEVYRGPGTVVATTFSGLDGSFAAPVPGGESHLRAVAPGLRGVRSVQQNGRLVLVMAVATEVQQLTITEGRVLRFRPADSIDPEYTPPAAVKAWLQYTYGICPSAPLTSYERRALKKYWYLDVLRSEPPNPASVSTTTCTTPSAYQPTPVPTKANLAGFDIWLDAVPGQP